MPANRKARRRDNKPPAGLTPEEAYAIAWDWPTWARPSQIVPAGEWLSWLVMAGRGWGKTRTGAEAVRYMAETGRASRIALIARTPADVRDVMLEGESGLLAISPPHFMPTWEPSKRRVTWPNGAIATTYSAEVPDALRGPQHDFAWGDELASWKYLDAAYDNLMLGLRIGSDPRCMFTTTPKHIPRLREIMAEPGTHITRGSTYENLVNLAPPFRERIVAKYEGTRLAAQELDGEMMEDVEGALWTMAGIDANRVSKAPEMIRIAVGVDPAVTSTKHSDETGIVCVGRARDGHLYILSDDSLRASNLGWARAVVASCDRHHADVVIGEVNNGGDLVAANIKAVDPSVPFRKVHASRGKYTRAEPISLLAEQGKLHHVGRLAELETQLTSWTQGDNWSPDRMDAMVWACTELSKAQGGVLAVA